MTYRVFIAHSRDADDADIAATVAHLTVRFAPVRAGGHDFTITTARQDFTTAFPPRATGRAQRPSMRRWAAWMQSVAARFTHIVVPGGTYVGRATADICRRALAARRTVAVATAPGAYLPVVGVEVIDGEDWKWGWRLTVTDLTGVRQVS